MRIFSDLEFFLARFASSPYFHSLLQRPSELAYKYPTSSPLHDLSDGLRILDTEELERARDILQNASVYLFQHFPILHCVRIHINILFLTDPRIENGSSWTDGSTIILASWQSLAHEMCHLFQRATPSIFNNFYLRLGFLPLSYETYHDLLLKFPDTLIDNPDMCSSYYSIQGWICAYQRGMRPVLVHPHTFQIRPASRQFNHPHEMLAEWFEASIPPASSSLRSHSDPGYEASSSPRLSNLLLYPPGGS